jgi:gamma-glutamylcyclotransferase
MLYFAYGSNMALDHLQGRCPEAVPYGPALLSGYRIGFRYPSTSFPGGSAADIVRDANARVWGVLFEITEGDIQALDGFEDVDLGGYRRIPIDVLYDGLEVEAWSYEVIDKLDDDYRPVPEYLELMIEGALQAGLPETYIEEIEIKAIEARPFSEQRKDSRSS